MSILLSKTFPPRGSRKAARRTALFLGTATLAFPAWSPALAQERVIYAVEGQTIQGDVILDGDDRLVVDITRADPLTGALNLGTNGSSPPIASGTVIAGGGDRVWLRSGITGVANIVRAPVVQNTAGGNNAVFSGGTVYEAAGEDTTLTLQNRGTPGGAEQRADLANGPVRLAGDGTVHLDFDMQADNQPFANQSAIFVAAGSTAQALGQGGDGKLTVIVSRDVTGSDVGRNADGTHNNEVGLIDVRNAQALRLDTGARVSVKDGIAVLAGDTAVAIARNAIVAVAGTDTPGTSGEDGVGISTSGMVTNLGLVNADNSTNSKPATARGIVMNSGTLHNQRLGNDVGRVAGGSIGVDLIGGANLIVNDGRISSVRGPAVRSSGGGSTNVLRNNAQGEIVGGSDGGDRVAYENAGNDTDVLVNSGTITGNVLLGGRADMFLYTGATNGVTGAIEGGADSWPDAYGRSFSQSASYVLSNAILNSGNTAGFEMHGVEASGADTLVTLSASETLNAGVQMIGDGTVVVDADITTAGDGLWQRSFDSVPGGLRVVNKGIVTAGLQGFSGGDDLARFENQGTIRSERSAVHIFTRTARAGALNIVNNGLMESNQYDTTLALGVSRGHLVDSTVNVLNAGTIRQSGALSDPAEQWPIYAVDLSVYDLGQLHFDNSGAIEALGNGVTGAYVMARDIDVRNTGRITAAGAGARGLFVASIGESLEPGVVTTRILNEGTISANGGGYVNDEEHVINFGLGVLIPDAIEQEGAVEVRNSGTIEATGARSAAVMAVTTSAGEFILDNSGTIRGGADTIFVPGQTLVDRMLGGYLSDETVTRTLAGAIHTFNTTDRIRNSGTIVGNVDLAGGDDRFENHGTVTGDVRLGQGDDAYVFGATNSLTGTASGGLGTDTLFVDLTGEANKRIGASQYGSFERIYRLAGTSGTGKLSLHGDFDVASIEISDLTVHVDAGDSVTATIPGNVFTGADTEETIINAGTIGGGVSLFGGRDTFVNAATGAVDYVFMGAGNDVVTNDGAVTGNVAMHEGDDTLTNSGTIGGIVEMGIGNDVVVNAGTIAGPVYLMEGDDRYESLGGVVTSVIDGGAGTDTFVFRLNGNDGAIPGGFVNFESFGAYGPGTLTLALNQAYDTIELLEGANLTLEDGAGSVGQIKGDDSAQTVTVEDTDFAGGVDLAGGEDTLSLTLNGALSGALDGGAGRDTLALNLLGASSIDDLYNFEVVNVSGASPLTLTGTLGADQQINFTGADDNLFVIAAGATFNGKADGGIGVDTLQIETGAADSRTILAGQLTSFEHLDAHGAGTLELNGGAYEFTSADVEGKLGIGDGASLSSADGVRFSAADNRLTLTGTGTLNGLVDGGAGTDTLAFALAAGQTRNLSSVSASISAFEQLATSGAGTLNVDRDASYQSVMIEGGNLNVAAGATLTAHISGGEGASADTLSVAAGGVVAGDVGLGAGNDVVINGGTIAGNVDLGDGDDRYVALAGSGVGGVLDGGSGDNTFIFRLENGTGTVPTNVLNFNSFGAYGPGTLNVNLDAGQQYNTLELLEGANLVVSGTNGSLANVIGDDSSQTVTINDALTGGVALGGGDDTLNLTLGGTLSGALLGGENADGSADGDLLNLTLTGDSQINGMNEFETVNVDAASGLSLTMAGEIGAGQSINFTGDADNHLILAASSTLHGTVNGGAGDDLLEVATGTSDERVVVSAQIQSFEDLVATGSGTLVLDGGAYAFDSVLASGDLSLGTGVTLVVDGEGPGVVFDGSDNRLTLASGAGLAGRIDAGAGMDTLALVQIAGARRALSALDAHGFERLESSGEGALDIDRDAAFAQGVSIDGGIVNVLAGRTLTADVTGGAGNDTLSVFGSVSGNVDLGAGDDRLVINSLAGVTGSMSGGAGGNDLVEFDSDATYEAPITIAGNRFDGFEHLGVRRGVVSLTGASDWSQVTVSGGRLIGQAGSTLTADLVTVAAGGTFGSAGTVNADIDVRGTLSPGASPGTMTINGDVTMRAGSNLLIELTPSAGTDLLDINGTLAIENGAAIDITGALAGNAGSLLDLVVADTITGRFTTVNKSSTVFGFVVQNGNRIQIRSEFQDRGDYPTNVQASLAYSNQVLGDSYGVQAYTAALDLLTAADGTVNQRAFAQLTPEAYGSVLHTNIQDGLEMIETGRMLRLTAPGREGLYGFVQGMTGGNGSAGSADTGASRATSRQTGFLGGVGYGISEGRLRAGAFLGKTNVDQDIYALGASTRADGFLGGAFLDATAGGIGVHALVSYRDLDARTTRSLMASSSAATSSYGLTGWVADLSVDYTLSIGDMVLKPRAGVSYVQSERGAVLEKGAGAFSLSVDADSRSAWFADAGLNLSGKTEIGGVSVTSFVEAGVRQLLGDANVRVTGSYAGAPGAPMVVDGVRLDATAPRLAAGLAADVTDNIRVNVGYAGSFDNVGPSSVSGGVSIRF